MAITPTGYAHVRLTVRDIEKSRAFYDAVFGLPVALEVPPDADEQTKEQMWWLFGGVVYSIGSQLFGLRPAAPGDDVFDENRVGLDHVAFSVADRAALDDAIAVLEEQSIHHEGVKDIGAGYILEFRDPDGVALELFASAG